MSLILKSPDITLFGGRVLSGISSISSAFDLTAAGKIRFDADAISFNGTSGYIQYGGNGWTYEVGENNDITVSFWVKPNIGANQFDMIISSGPTTTSTFLQYVAIQSNASSQLRIVIRHISDSSNSSDGVSYNGTYGSINNNAWNHIMYSFDNSANNLEVAINDSDQSASNTTNGTNTFPVSNTSNPVVGRSGPSSDHYTGCLAEFWMDNVLYDASVESNRRNFIDSDGLPVDPPSSPLVYLHGSASTWTDDGDNITSMGIQTLNNITDCADSPSD